MTFFVYIHKKATDGRVFYVGKGCRYRHNTKWGRSQYWHNTVNKYGYTVEIVKHNLTEDQAYQLEIQLIKKYKRENLCNFTNGGEGAPGVTVSEQTKALLKKQRQSKKWRENLRQKAIERYKDPDFLAAHKERVKEIASRPEVKVKISTTLKDYFSDPKNIARLKRQTTEFFKNPAARKLASQKAKERFNSPEKRAAHAQAKIVKCVETGMIFGTGTLAAEWIASQGIYKGDHSSIARAARNKTTAYGYRWRYVNRSKATAYAGSEG